MAKIVKDHIGAYGIIINDDKILLVKKAYGGYKGKYDLPGGGVEHYELPIDALKREIMEEAGLNVLTNELFDATSTNIVWKMHDNVWEDLHHFGILYKVTAKGQIKIDSDGKDSNGALYKSISTLKKQELTPFVIYSLEKLGYILKD